MERLPAEFVKKMKSLLGAEWEAFLDCYENDRYQALRLNPLKKGKKDRSEVLRGIGVDADGKVPWASDGFYYEQSDEPPYCQPGKHPYHEIGLYYIQEPSAMSAAAMLAPKPGERVLDLCAAPGGKTTQLASYMKQEGILVANEIHPARAKILAQNVERMGIANTVVTNADGKLLMRAFPGFFDCILADAPCSGEGMFRKNPEALSNWSPQNVALCADRQEEILECADRMLSPGGRLVYSTCTFSPEENEQVIASFLKKHPDYALVEPPKDGLDRSAFSRARPEWGDGSASLRNACRLWPHKLHGEGHFAALLQKDGQKRTAPAARQERKKNRRDCLDKQMQEELEAFLQETFREEMVFYLLDGRLIRFGDQLYRLPDGAPPMEGIRVLRAGLHIGTFKKNRFEPAHALALFAGEEDARKCVSLSAQKDGEELRSFLRGEALYVPVKKGWNLICADGFSAGWGKSAGGVIKNHYPKGLRIQ